MKQDEACVVLCRKKHKKADIEVFKQMIDAEYRVHWLLDNLPVAVRNDELGYVSRGYPIGFLTAGTKFGKNKHYLFNHVRIVVRYNEAPGTTTGITIVGFEVVPFSIKHSYDSSNGAFNKDSTVLSTCNQFSPAAFNPDKFQVVESADEEVN
jgi:transmembrane 9 superfamily protein 2/4